MPQIEPIDIEFSEVGRRRPSPIRRWAANADDVERILNLAAGCALLSFAMYCVHLFLKNNFG